MAHPDQRDQEKKVAIKRDQCVGRRSLGALVGNREAILGDLCFAAEVLDGRRVVGLEGTPRHVPHCPPKDVVVPRDAWRVGVSRLDRCESPWLQGMSVANLATET